MSPGFTMLDNDAVLDRLPEIPPPAVKVLLVLKRRANGQRECWPAVDSIGHETGLCVRAVRKALHDLVDLRLLALNIRPGTSTMYRLLTPNAGCTPDEQVGTSDGSTPLTSHERGGGTSDGSTPLTSHERGTRTNEQEPLNKKKRTRTNSRPKLRFDESDRASATWMFSLIQALDPKAREPNFDKWANTIRLMRETDQRSDVEIRAVFQWANADSFWRANILSPDKLRDKFSQLRLQMERKTHEPSKNNPGCIFNPDATG
jgi:hypothetical protein